MRFGEQLVVRLVEQGGDLGLVVHLVERGVELGLDLYLLVGEW